LPAWRSGGRAALPVFALYRSAPCGAFCASLSQCSVFEEKQNFLLLFSSLALAGNRLAEVCYGTLRRLIGGEPVSDRYVSGFAWEINVIRRESRA
jgi:hypothetical protein